MSTEDLRGRRKILVVVDSAAVLSEVVSFLGRMGLEVQEADNGTTALEMIEAEVPDLIILDIDMSEPGGLDLLRTLRSDARFEAVPVIVLSGSADTELVTEAAALRISGNLVKSSLSAGEVEKRIGAAIAAATVDLAVEEGSAEAGEGVFDAAELLERVDGEAELLQRMTELYIRDYGDLLVRIREAIVNADGKEFHDATHTIKGMFGNLSAHRGYAIAQELEEMESMEDAAAVKETYARLQDQAELLSRALTGYVDNLSID